MGQADVGSSDNLEGPVWLTGRRFQKELPNA
jgi:hypothetical protein